MAKQVFGRNGQPAGTSSGGGGSGGGGSTFVTTPGIRGGSRVAIGRPNEFSLSAMCLLSNARVLWFMVEATGGATGGTFPATLEKDGKNTAVVRVTVPAGTQVGATIHITVKARDNYGNESLPAEIAVTAATGYVETPVLSAPLPSAEVSPASFYTMTEPFSVLGDADIQVAAQYLVVTDTEDSEVLYDSGELTDATEFTKHSIKLYDIPTVRTQISVQARHKGKDNGWSDYSEPVHCAVSIDRLVIAALDTHVSTVDFYKMSEFSSDGYTLPNKAMIYNMFEHKNTYIALTKDGEFWKVYTSTDLKNWEGPFTVDLITNMSAPSFCEFNGYLFLSGRSIWRSPDIGKTWTSVAVTAVADTSTFYGSFCSDEKYCYYVRGYVYNTTGYTTLYRSNDGLTFTNKQIAESIGVSSAAAYKAACGRCMSGALGDGLVIFGSNNTITLYVSNDYGETFSEVVVQTNTFQVTQYNERAFFRFGASVYSIYHVYLTKASADGKYWGTPLDLYFGAITSHSIGAGKISLWGSTSGYKESTNAESWATIGTRLHLALMTSYKYFKPKNGDHIIYHANYFRSPDLIDWRSLEGIELGLPNNLNWYDSCYAFGKYFRVGGAGSNGYISTSLDGAIWSAPEQSHSAFWKKIVFANGKLVISDEDRYIRFSNDGETWSVSITPGDISGARFGASNNGYFYWMGTGSSASRSRYSRDLNTWVDTTDASSARVGSSYAVICGDDCCLHTCRIDLGSSYDYGATLIRDTGYKTRVPSLNTYGEGGACGAYGNNIFVLPVATGGVVIVSKAPAILGTALLASGVSCIKFLRGAFYVTLRNGMIQRSTDGFAWSPPVPAVREYAVNSTQSVIMSNV